MREESADLRIPYCPCNRDSSLRICIAEAFILKSVCIDVYR